MVFGEKRPVPTQTPSSASPKTVEINAEMHGSLTFKESVDLKINGIFSGSLDIKGTLTVGVNAQIEGDINGDNVIIAGRIKGNVSVTRMLTLMPTAVLIGDISAPKLNIVEGAVFQGTSRMPSTSSNDSMDIRELASYLELDESVIIELVRSGKIPVIKEGDSFKFERREIDNWAVSGIVK